MNVGKKQGQMAEALLTLFRQQAEEREKAHAQECRCMMDMLRGVVASDTIDNMKAEIQVQVSENVCNESCAKRARLATPEEASDKIDKVTTKIQTRPAEMGIASDTIDAEDAKIQSQSRNWADLVDTDSGSETELEETPAPVAAPHVAQLVTRWEQLAAAGAGGGGAGGGAAAADAEEQDPSEGDNKKHLDYIGEQIDGHGAGPERAGEETSAEDGDEDAEKSESTNVADDGDENEEDGVDVERFAEDQNWTGTLQSIAEDGDEDEEENESTTVEDDGDEDEEDDEDVHDGVGAAWLEEDQNWTLAPQVMGWVLERKGLFEAGRVAAKMLQSHVQETAFVDDVRTIVVAEARVVRDSDDTVLFTVRAEHHNSGRLARTECDIKLFDTLVRRITYKVRGLTKTPDADLDTMLAGIRETLHQKARRKAAEDEDA